MRKIVLGLLFYAMAAPSAFACSSGPDGLAREFILQLRQDWSIYYSLVKSSKDFPEVTEAIDRQYMSYDLRPMSHDAQGFRYGLALLERSSASSTHGSSGFYIVRLSGSEPQIWLDETYKTGALFGPIPRETICRLLGRS